MGFFTGRGGLLSGRLLAGVGGALGSPLIASYDISTKTLTGTAVPDATVLIYKDTVEVDSATADSSGNWSYVFATAPAAGAVLGVRQRVATTSGFSNLVPVPGPSVTLGVLSLTATSFAAGAAPGTVIGAIVGKTAGSTVTIEPADGRVTISGNNLIAGLTPAAQGSFDITLRETLGGASNSPRDTTLTLTATPASIPLGTILAARIRPDGWTMEVDVKGFKANGTISLTPFTSPKVELAVVSPGYDATGALGTINRQVVANVAPTTVSLRQPYPNQTTRVETITDDTLTLTLVLSDPIYDSDDVTSAFAAGWLVDNGSGGSGSSSLAASGTVTNGSTETAPKAIAHWAIPPHQLALGSSFPVELEVAHRHGQQGRMAACVEFIATGQTSGATASVTSASMVEATYQRAGLKVPVFKGAIPLAGFTQGEEVVVDAKIYPFVGGSASIHQASVDGEAWPTPNYSTLRFVCDKSSALTSYAYVDAAGNDGTGVVNATAATAAANPFATIAAAANAGATRIRLNAGAWALAAAITATTGLFWRTIERNPSLNRADVTLGIGAQKGFWNSKTKVSGMVASVASNAAIFDPADSTLSRALWIDDCDLDGAGNSTPIVYRVGLIYWTNCSYVNGGSRALQPLGNVKVHHALAIGCSFDRCGQHFAYAALGNVYDTSTGTNYTMPLDTVAGGANVVQATGQFIGFNKIMRLAGGSYPDWGSNTAIAKGLAIVGNLFERSATVNPVFRVSGDGSTTAVENAVIAYNSTAGGRINVLYQDAGSLAIRKTGVLRFNLLYEWNNKTDTFVGAPDGNRIGNWAFNHQVGWSGNVALKLASAGGSTPAPDNWAGGAFGRDTEINVTTAAVAFTGYAGISTSGSAGAGNGNYRIGSGSVAKGRVPAGMQMLPFDLDGIARDNAGAGAAGAYEAAA